MMSTRKYLKALCLLIVLVIANARRGKDANMSLLFTSWKKLFELGEWGCQLPTEATGTHPPTTDRVVCLITTYCGPLSLLCVKCLSPNSEWRSVKTENSNWPEQRLREESIVLPQINQCPSLVLMGDEWSYIVHVHLRSTNNRFSDTTWSRAMPMKFWNRRGHFGKGSLSQQDDWVLIKDPTFLQG